MKKLVVYFLVVSTIWCPAFAQSQQYQTPAVIDNAPFVQIIEKNNLALRARVLVHIHTAEKYTGLTFQWCTYVGEKEDCSRFLGCRDAGNVYTIHELNRERNWRRAKMWTGVGVDAILAVAAVVGAIYAYAAVAGATVGSVLTGIVSSIPGLRWVASSVGTGVVNKVTPLVNDERAKVLVAYIKDRLGFLVGLSAVGVTGVSYLIGKCTSFLNFANAYGEAHLVSWDFYSEKKQNHLSVAKDLNEVFTDLNSMLCTIDQDGRRSWRNPMGN